VAAPTEGDARVTTTDPGFEFDQSVSARDGPDL
jgi:hypothetical protein